MALPTSYNLFQNYPNPFNSTTLIRYHLPAVGGRLPKGSRPLRDGASAVTLRVYNILGQEVRTLVDREHAPGCYSVVWDGRDGNGKEVSSGIYFCQFKTEDFQGVRKLLLLK